LVDEGNVIRVLRRRPVSNWGIARRAKLASADLRDGWDGSVPAKAPAPAPRV